MARFACNAGRWMMAAAVVLLASCATGPRITSDVDPSASFGQYRSFAFIRRWRSKGRATPR